MTTMGAEAWPPLPACPSNVMVGESDMSDFDTKQLPAKRERLACLAVMQTSEMMVVTLWPRML